MFLAVVGICLLANAASFFALSSGYGVLKVNDGIIRVGFPFLMFEEGGFAYRCNFYWKAAAGNLSVALLLGALVSTMWHFMRQGEDGEGQ